MKAPPARFGPAISLKNSLTYPHVSTRHSTPQQAPPILLQTTLSNTCNTRA